jgi:nucleoid DNA-binding protein
MNRKELDRAIANRLGISLLAAKEYGDVWFDVIISQLANGNPVKLIGFLDFSVRETSETFVHPITKAIHRAKYRKAVRTKIGKTFKSRVNKIENKEDGKNLNTKVTKNITNSKNKETNKK